MVRPYKGLKGCLRCEPTGSAHQLRHAMPSETYLYLLYGAVGREAWRRGVQRSWPWATWCTWLVSKRDLCEDYVLLKQALRQGVQDATGWVLSPRGADAEAWRL